MCCGCWKEEGSPQVDNERVRAASLLVSPVYDHSGVGGNLHIALDDYNLEDSSLAFCRRHIEGNPHGDSPEQIACEMACLVAFEGLTEEERYSALALADGYWGRQA